MLRGGQKPKMLEDKFSGKSRYGISNEPQQKVYDPDAKTLAYPTSESFASRYLSFVRSLAKEYRLDAFYKRFKRNLWQEPEAYPKKNTPGYPGYDWPDDPDDSAPASAGMLLELEKDPKDKDDDPRAPFPVPIFYDSIEKVKKEVKKKAEKFWDNIYTSLGYVLGTNQLALGYSEGNGMVSPFRRI